MELTCRSLSACFRDWRARAASALFLAALVIAPAGKATAQEGLTLDPDGIAAPSDLILTAVPCGDKWCRISTIYDFSDGKWHLSSRIEFTLPPKWN